MVLHFIDDECPQCHQWAPSPRLSFLRAVVRTFPLAWVIA